MTLIERLIKDLNSLPYYSVEFEEAFEYFLPYLYMLDRVSKTQKLEGATMGSLVPRIITPEMMTAEFSKAAVATFSYSDCGQGVYPTTVACSHEFVNVSFAHIKMVCKKCDAEQPEDITT